jgi:hypothetical protein
LSNGTFPYESINSSNYDEILSKQEQFEHIDFYSSLNRKNISNDDYNSYLDDSKRFKTR